MKQQFWVEKRNRKLSHDRQIGARAHQRPSVHIHIHIHINNNINLSLNFLVTHRKAKCVHYLFRLHSHFVYITLTACNYRPVIQLTWTVHFSFFYLITIHSIIFLCFFFIRFIQKEKKTLLFLRQHIND